VAIQHILLITQEVVDEFLMKFFEGWDVALATNYSVLGLIRITTRIQEFWTEFYHFSVVVPVKKLRA